MGPSCWDVCGFLMDTSPRGEIGYGQRPPKNPVTAGGESIRSSWPLPTHPHQALCHHLASLLMSAFDGSPAGTSC